MHRRRLLVGAAAIFGAACTQPAVRREPTPPSTAAEFEPWNREARAILSDGLETLQTFEIYAAFRVSNAEQSDRRAATDLAWDPPSGVAWGEATHVARGLHGRAEQLFQRVSGAQVDPGVWRQQRDLATWTNDLLDLGDALDAFRTRVDRLAPGSDATQTWELLDRAWQRWDISAARWGVSRSEPIACASS
jgi:hypothetical protein